MKKEVDQKVVTAFLESMVAYGKTSNGGVRQVITNERDFASQLVFVRDVAQRLLKSSGTCFSNREEKDGRSFLKANKLGRDFLILLNFDFESIRRHFYRHRFHPLVRLVFQAVIDHKLDHVSNLTCDRLLREDGLVTALNGCVEYLRKVGATKENKALVSDFSRLARKNYQGLSKYFEQYCDSAVSHVLLRFDLGYIATETWPFDPTGLGENLDEVREHRQQLIRHLRAQKIIGGYVLRLDHSMTKGFGYHLLVVLAKSRSINLMDISKSIGEQWTQVITNGKGVFFDCAQSICNFKRSGIGVLRKGYISSDGLLCMLIYLTKTDSLMQLALSGRNRSFWKAGTGR